MKTRRLSSDGVAGRLSSLGIKVISRSPLPYGERLDVARGADTAVVNVYSGKKGVRVVVQGRSTVLIKTIGELFPPPLPRAPNATIEPAGPYIGSDESGKGDYFGPLCVAAFLSDPRADERLLKLGARDSKKLSDDSALDIAARLKSSFPGRAAVISLEPREYNRAYALERSGGGNLNTLLSRLHAEAISSLTSELKSSLPDFPSDIRVITDAFSLSPRVRERISESSGVPPDKVMLVERAESYPAVAAASVLARAAYLRGLAALERLSGVRLPKGAGPEVIRARRAFVEERGEKHLSRFAKISFKIA